MSCGAKHTLFNACMGLMGARATRRSSLRPTGSPIPDMVRIAEGVPVIIVDTGIEE